MFHSMPKPSYDTDIMAPTQITTRTRQIRKKVLNLPCFRIDVMHNVIVILQEGFPGASDTNFNDFYTMFPLLYLMQAPGGPFIDA